MPGAKVFVFERISRDVGPASVEGQTEFCLAGRFKRRGRSALVLAAVLPARPILAPAGAPADLPREVGALKSTTLEANTEIGESASVINDAESRIDDFWTADQLTGDWGGFRSELEEHGFSMKLSYQSQYQQNYGSAYSRRSRIYSTSACTPITKIRTA